MVEIARWRQRIHPTS